MRHPAVDRGHNRSNQRKRGQSEREPVLAGEPARQERDGGLRGEDQYERDAEALPVINAPRAVFRALHVNVATGGCARPPRPAPTAENPGAKIDGKGRRGNRGECEG